MRDPALAGDTLLVGRGPLLDALQDAVTRPDLHGAFVVGDTGTGKTALARHLIDRVRASAVPFLLHPGPAPGNVPYAALAPFLGSATVRDMQSSLSVLRILISFFREEAQGRPVLLVVDDAHEVDDESSRLLSQLVTSRTVKLVAFARALPPRSEELVALSHEGLLARFEVGPLEPSEVDEVCRQVLGGDLVRGVSDRLREESGGVPLFLRALLDQLLENGGLTENDGVWSLSDELQELPPSLVDLVRGITLRLPREERKAFEVLALAEPVPFAELTRMSDENAVANLLEAGLIEGLPTSPAFAVNAHALYGRAMRELIPAGRSASLHEEMMGGAVPVPTVGRGALRRLHWDLDCGQVPPDGALLDAARSAHRIFDVQSVLRFAGAMRDGEHDAEARLALARAHLALAHLHEAGELLRGVAQEAHSLDVAADAVVLGAELALRQGQPPARLQALADQWTALAGQRSTAAGADPGTGASAGRILLLRCLGLNLEGRFAASESQLRSLVAAADDPRTQAQAQALLGEALGWLGRSTEGRAHTAAALAMAQAEPALSDLTGFVFARHLVLLLHAGEFTEAETALAAASRWREKDYSFIGGTLAALDGAWKCAGAGSAPDLVKLRPALEALRRSDARPRPAVHARGAALAAGALEDRESAQSWAAEFRKLARRGSRLCRLSDPPCCGRRATSAEPETGSSTDSGPLPSTPERVNADLREELLEILVTLGDRRAAPRLSSFPRGWRAGRPFS
jgi:hypothetical protein